MYSIPAKKMSAGLKIMGDLKLQSQELDKTPGGQAFWKKERQPMEQTLWHIWVEATELRGIGIVVIESAQHLDRNGVPGELNGFPWTLQLFVLKTLCQTCTQENQKKTCGSIEK